MNTLSQRWIDQLILSSGDAMPLISALDVGEFTMVDLVVTVESEGTGAEPAFGLEHAPTNETGAYIDLDPVQTVDLTAAGKTWIHLDRFTRFLGWSLSGSLDTQATITVDVVARR